jgi:hypothetical protein
LRKCKRSGILFCAKVELADERRTFLRIVPAEPGWQQPDATKAIERETGSEDRLDGTFSKHNVRLVSLTRPGIPQ